MEGLIDWARDVLVTRGALVEMEEDSSLRAMLPAEVASVLETSEWLSLRLGAGPGRDDEGDWLERIGRLLPSDARVAAARLRVPRPSAAVDAAAVLERHLVIQNGVHRLLDHGPATARYCFFTFGYTIESDETNVGMWTVCLNATARAVVSQAEAMLRALHGGLEEEPESSAPREEIGRLFSVALRAAQPEIRRAAATAEQNAVRRMARDAERLQRYYRDLMTQIEKRITRRAADPAAAEKERSRAAATELDRMAKLEDLARKYRLKIRVEPGDVLLVSLPVVEIAARVIRKKAERTATLHWNSVLRILESPWCEGCCAPAAPLFLCNEQVHFLCRTCQEPCAACGRHRCRACQGKCKCGAN